MTPKRSDGAHPADLETIRQGIDLKVKEITAELKQWILTRDRQRDHGAMILALLEVGIESHLEYFDEKSTGDLLQDVFRKILKRHLGIMQ